MIQKLCMCLEYCLKGFEEFLTPFLQNLDPSLFQNIILGILAIFIPFGIVFLTDILNSKNEKRSEFEKMVLSHEVLVTKKVFWLSIFGIVFFAFFSGAKASSSVKILSINTAIILILLFWKSFEKILRFSEGYKPEFEIYFLKSLNFSKIFKFRNQAKAERMVRAWNSFWAEKTEFREQDFTKIFISHVEDALNHKRFELVIELAETYFKSIEKRNFFLMGHDILPKVFEWNETLWNEQQLWLKASDTEQKIKKSFSYFPFLRDLVLKFHKKFHSKSEYFWNWDYFGREFFQAIIKVLLKDGHGPYELFSSFKKHIEESEKKLNKNIKEEEKDRHSYIEKLFESFCPTFFDEIHSLPSNHDIWEHNFPREWKITIANKENLISHIILYEFLKWAKDRIFKKESEHIYDKDLSEVIGGIFPNVDSSLFEAFLMLYHSNGIKDALEKESNLYIFDKRVSWSSSIGESEEERNKKLLEIREAEEILKKESTIQIVLKFFNRWSPLSIYREDLTNDELKNCEGYTEEQRKLILKKVRKEKLEKIRGEIESNEIKELCKESELKELYRKDFLELIELLILEIQCPC